MPRHPPSPPAPLTPDQLYDQVVAGFSHRGFSAGLAVAFANLLSHLQVPGQGLSSFADLLKRHRRVTKTPKGQHVNTLAFEEGGKIISLRRFYDAAEKLFREDHKRYEYPSCAPHATGQWEDYVPWLDALVTFSPKEIDTFRQRVVDFVLARLPSQEFDPSTVQLEPPLFRRILEAFDLSARKGEPTGAAYQGVVFGFLRADNPHLQVEIDKVRTGSKRLQRIADVDGWDGARLAISAEVKQYRLEPKAASELSVFADEVKKRGAIGMVVALGFEPDAREAIEALGVSALDTDDLLRIVTLWDPLKQRTAVQSMLYYLTHVEKNKSLTQRLTDFLDLEARPKQP